MAQALHNDTCGYLITFCIPTIPIVNSELLPSKSWPPIQGMRFLSSILILLPDLDGLVRLARDQSHPCQIECRCHDTRLRIQRTGLCDRVFVLEFVPGLPVPECNAAVVATGEENVLLVDGECVDHAVVAFEVLHEIAARAEPLLDLSRRCGGECVFCGVDCEIAHALFVMCEYAHGLAGCEVVHSDGAVERARHDLGIGGLCLDAGHGSFVSGQDVDVATRTHIPDTDDTIATTGTENIKSRVQRQCVDTAKVTVVMPDHLVGLEIPALHHLVLAT
jgi:hypothetical protein